ncbi:hypothetical protein CPB83DRAFT_849616 [Crepidotus variabilis]|uniref:Uncharacterized protein n=1 Tax=Crepidotus variabilis TaxID=179855 RepID=A0A9P6ELR5_9AGAR|nr:hypothetical protein CPB83DRAFT_849616 [Crepidotus variabilis]
MADAVNKNTDTGLSTTSPAGISDKDKQTTDDAQKIKDGFEDMTNGKDDPRIGMGKIPHPAPPAPSTEAAKTIAGISNKDKATADDAQKIKEGFEDILKGKDDPRSGFGRIPKKNPVAGASDAGTASGKPLSPDAQAIKDGFDEMLNGKNDPRMGFGRIPKTAGTAQDPPRTNVP